MPDLTAFAGIDAVTPADSGHLRHYIIDCSHGTTQLDVPRRREEDHIVMAMLLPQHRNAIFLTEHEECDCEPTEEQLHLLGRDE